MQKVKRLNRYQRQLELSVIFAGVFFSCNVSDVITRLNNINQVNLNYTTDTLFKEIKYRVFYGDLHNHSTISDGMGSPDYAYMYARDTAGLDFFSLADHAGGITDEEWEKLKKTADIYNEDGVFSTFWGFEWSAVIGHVAVIGTDDFCQSRDSTINTFLKLCHWLSTRDGVAFFNHPNRPRREDLFDRFETGPSDKFVGMELWNGKHGFEDYYYNDGLFPDDRNKSYFDEALSRGWKIGASGAGDNHKATWGMVRDYRMAVLATDHTREAIYSAFKARRFYSTLDKNIRLSFRINKHEMGSTVTGHELQLKISATDDDEELFSEIKMFNMNHDTVRVWNLDMKNVVITDSIMVQKDDYFYIKITQKDSDEAISSPIWVLYSAH